MTTTLRRAHTCQIRTTSALDSPLCGAPAFTLRYDWVFRAWVCAEHDRFGGEPHSTDPGVWPADRRWFRTMNH